MTERKIFDLFIKKVENNSYKLIEMKQIQPKSQVEFHNQNYYLEKPYPVIKQILYRYTENEIIEYNIKTGKLFEQKGASRSVNKNQPKSPNVQGQKGKNSTTNVRNRLYKNSDNKK